MTTENITNNIPTDITKSDDDLLKDTQMVRLGIVNALTKKGQCVPDDLKEMSMLLETIRDIDKTIIAKKKIVADVNKGNSDREAMLIMASVLKNTSLIDNPLRNVNNTSGKLLEPDDSQIPKVIPFTGETDIGISSETYDEFNARVESSLYKNE